ncbi:MAG: glycosyltransferase [Bacteroidia bacterium]
MKEEKLTVLFLSSWYPSRVMPTLGNFVQKHAEAVAIHSNVIALFACSDSGCKQPFEVVESTINNVYTVNVYYKKVEHSIPFIAQFQKLSRYLKAYKLGLETVEKKARTIDVIHHNILYPAGIIAWYLKKTKGIPYVVSEHWTGYLAYKKTKINAFQKWVSKVVARNADLVLPVSEDLENAMKQQGLSANYEIVYNVTDTRLFYPSGDKPAERKIKFLHISTLDDAHKNISGMLEAVAALYTQRQDFEFWFVGDGDATPHIHTAKKLGIYNSVAFFDGTKTTQEVAELMRHSDCFVLFSNYENLPCVLIEAMASGLPVISSWVGGIPEHITEDFGLLVPPADIQALVSALAEMLEAIRQKKYDKKLLNDYARAYFSYESVSQRIHEVYRQVI